MAVDINQLTNDPSLTCSILNPTALRAYAEKTPTTRAQEHARQVFSYLKAQKVKRANQAGKPVLFTGISKEEWTLGTQIEQLSRLCQELLPSVKAATKSSFKDVVPGMTTEVINKELYGKATDDQKVRSKARSQFVKVDGTAGELTKLVINKVVELRHEINLEKKEEEQSLATKKMEQLSQEDLQATHDWLIEYWYKIPCAVTHAFWDLHKFHIKNLNLRIVEANTENVLDKSKQIRAARHALKDVNKDEKEALFEAGKEQKMKFVQSWKKYDNNSWQKALETKASILAKVESGATQAKTAINLESLKVIDNEINKEVKKATAKLEAQINADLIAMKAEVEATFERFFNSMEKEDTKGLTYQLNRYAQVVELGYYPTKPWDTNYLSVPRTYVLVRKEPETKEKE